MVFLILLYFRSCVILMMTGIVRMVLDLVYWCWLSKDIAL